MSIPLIEKIDNIFEDGIGFVAHYDFSTANTDDNSRLMAITKALGSQALYDRLLSESGGIPISSFEFVPMLFTEPEIEKLYIEKKLLICENNPLTKFGEWIFHKGNKYLLTNFRAVVNLKETSPEIDFTKKYNTLDECKIIAEYFKVFLFKVDFPTSSQMVRHIVNWQELSRRYVSGSRVPNEYLITEKMKDVKSYNDITYYNGNYLTKEIIDICLAHYQAALNSGVKPQEARRIIPQAGYTLIWGGFQPTQLENYFKIRDDSHAQHEIRQTAIAMKKLINYIDKDQQ